MPAGTQLKPPRAARISDTAQAGAGLRTFAADKTPIVGFDPDIANFMWLAGQGGYGFQTSPALAGFVCDLVAGRPLAAKLQDLGLTAGMLSPARFHEPQKTGRVRA